MHGPCLTKDGFPKSISRVDWMKIRRELERKRMTRCVFGVKQLAPVVSFTRYGSLRPIHGIEPSRTVCTLLVITQAPTRALNNQT